jgi:S-adenosylmethionine-diacylglycerol 3-amino-3-carboxypropyl transferase
MRMPDRASEIATQADFSIIRYAQCWEDADVLLQALDIQPGDACFSVGSGGENTLSMLSKAPSEVLAIDLSPAQAACLELKAAGFQALPHAQLLELVGLDASTRRQPLYRTVRPLLTPSSRAYWDAHPAVLERGLVSAGRFEHYFELFRRWILPLIHSRRRVDELFEPRDPVQRGCFYRERWNNWRWQALQRLFFSRFVMGRLGRDPSFFRYVEGAVAAPIFERTERALAELDPSNNPYLQWIAYGRYVSALPHAWRAENFEAIRSGVPRLRIEVASVETALARAAPCSIDRFNLSDILEYVSEAGCERLFDAIVRCGRPGGRVVHWNMQARRQRPERLAARLRSQDELGRRLHRDALTFFYSALHVDELAPLVTHDGP